MIRTRRKKLVSYLLVLIAVLTAVYCYRNRFTKTGEEYTFTNYSYKNDELVVRITRVMNEYNDTLVSTRDVFYSDNAAWSGWSDIDYYYYKYDKAGNKKLCIMKDRQGDTESKEVFKYDRKGNCIFRKREDDDGYWISKTDYNEKNMMIRQETEIHDLKVDSHNICEYYYDENDRLISEKNTQSDNRYYEYDENGLLRAMTEDSRYGWSNKEEYDYNENGLLLRTVHYNPDNEASSETEYKYNDRAEVISEIKTVYSENENDYIYETCYTYDKNGNKTSETHISNGFKTEYISYGYDGASRLIEQSEYKYYKN